MTLYFNIQRLPRWKFAFYTNVGVASINGLSILAECKAKKGGFNETIREIAMCKCKIKIDSY